MNQSALVNPVALPHGALGGQMDFNKNLAPRENGQDNTSYPLQNQGYSSVINQNGLESYAAPYNNSLNPAYGNMNMFQQNQYFNPYLEKSKGGKGKGYRGKGRTFDPNDPLSSILEAQRQARQQGIRVHHSESQSPVSTVSLIINAQRDAQARHAKVLQDKIQGYWQDQFNQTKFYHVSGSMVSVKFEARAYTDSLRIIRGKLVWEGRGSYSLNFNNSDENYVEWVCDTERRRPIVWVRPEKPMLYMDTTQMQMESNGYSYGNSTQYNHPFDGSY